MKFLVFLTAIAAVPALPAFAQTAGMRGPVSGFLYQRGSRALRPVVGIPGAAYAGTPILDDIEAAWVAPGGKWAIVARDGRPALVPLSGLTPGEPSGTALLEAADRVVWSRDGSAALLYSSTRNLLQFVRISGGVPFAGYPIDLSPWGAAAALAIDTSGHRIAVGITGAGLFVFDAGQSPALLSAMEQPTAAAFDDSGRIYAVDGASQRVFQFNPDEGGTEFAVLSVPDGTRADVSALSVSGPYVMLADRAAQAVRVYDAASHALTNTLPLEFAPARIEAVSGTLFALNGDGENEFRLLDVRNTPAIFFVPAPAEERQ